MKLALRCNLLSLLRTNCAEEFWDRNKLVHLLNVPASAATDLGKSVAEHSIPCQIAHINPNWALGGQISLDAMFQLRCNQTQHVLTTTEELTSGSVIDVGLSLVEALL